MKQQKYCGFESYLKEKKITKEFINDFEYWCKKIFYHWKLFTTFEDFYSICWQALLEKLPTFDPNIATIQTLCLSRINNEAWRFYMKTKTIRRHGVEIDCDSPVIYNELIYDSSEKETFEDIYAFEQYCNTLGIKLNKKEFYQLCTETNKKKDNVNLAYQTWKNFIRWE